MKSIKSIPGPRGYLAWQCLTGSFNYLELHNIEMRLYRQYGPIVRQKILPGLNMVHLFDPADIGTIANDFSKKDFPRRDDHFALIKYKEDRPEIYSNAGLLASNGSEWWRLRSALQKNFSKPQYLRQFIPSTNEILKEFAETLKGTRKDDPEGSIDIEKYLSHLNLELLIHLTFGLRMNAITAKELHPDSLSSSLIFASYEANSLFLPLDQSPLWKLWKTPMYEKFCGHMDTLHAGGVHLLNAWAERVEKGQGVECLMDHYARDEKLSRKDLLGTIEEYLLAGIDTTSLTGTMLMYNVARNQGVQDKIVAEVNSVLGEQEEPTPEIMNTQIPYTKAVLKESLRLNPISIGFGRTLTKDTEIRGFMIPAKTQIVTQNLVASRLPENFHNPMSFIPERWLRDSDSKSSVHPHLVLPFGHGMRGCIARRFAEQNLLLTLIKMVRSFKIEYAGPSEDIPLECRLVMRPKYPVLLKLTPRN